MTSDERSLIYIRKVPQLSILYRLDRTNLATLSFRTDIMKFLSRIVDFWLHAILLTDGSQEPLYDPSASRHAIATEPNLHGATAITDSSSQCVHGPKSRRCWRTGFDITTDYELRWPNTGATRQVRPQDSL